MEQQNPRIDLETTTEFRLTSSEIRRMLLALALSQYRYDRHPDYDERHLLRQLDKDVSKYLVELEHLCACSPNNHNLIHIRSFFSHCHAMLGKVV